MFLLTQALVGAEVGLSSWSLAEYVVSSAPLTLRPRVDIFPFAAASTRNA